jgi:hypothetical protein
MRTLGGTEDMQRKIVEMSVDLVNEEEEGGNEEKECGYEEGMRI